MTFATSLFLIVVAKTSASNAPWQPQGTPSMTVAGGLQVDVAVLEKIQATLKIMPLFDTHTIRRLQAITKAAPAPSRRAQDKPTGEPGMPTCPCLGSLPDSVERVDCSYEWAFNGKCVVPTGLVTNFSYYPGDYGALCKTHPEPGHSACSDLTKVPPEAKTPSEQPSWCSQKWCYVDPCNCDSSDATKSDYFPGTMFYSYATCGQKNMYTALESATNTVGNAECATADPAPDGDDHDGHDHVAPEPAPAPETSEGWLSQGCLKACPKVESMLSAVGEATSKTTTTPAPGMEGTVFLNIMCENQESLDCLTAEKACQCSGNDNDCQDGRSIGQAYSCACACPGFAESGTKGKACTDKAGVMACLKSEGGNCKAYTRGMADDDIGKLMTLNCKRNEMDCGAKDDKVEDGECGQLDKFKEAGCEEAMKEGDFSNSEECCPLHEELETCRDVKCTELEMASAKIQSDHVGADDSHSQKQDSKETKEFMEARMKAAKECKVDGVPSTMDEVTTIIADTEGAPDASPATGFDALGVLELATAAAAFALVA